VFATRPVGSHSLSNELSVPEFLASFQPVVFQRLSRYLFSNLPDCTAKRFELLGTWLAFLASEEWLEIFPFEMFDGPVWDYDLVLYPKSLFPQYLEYSGASWPVAGSDKKFNFAAARFIKAVMDHGNAEIWDFPSTAIWEIDSVDFRPQRRTFTVRNWCSWWGSSSFELTSK
jgi:hypothetical protein